MTHLLVKQHSELHLEIVTYSSQFTFSVRRHDLCGGDYPIKEREII